MRLRSICRLSVVLSLALTVLAIGCTEQAANLPSSDSAATERSPSNTEQAVSERGTVTRTAATTSEDESAQAPADPSHVPDGTPAELIAYIEKLAQPEPFQTEEQMRNYMEPAAEAIVQAADRILENEQATDEELIDALEWKGEAYRVKDKLGDDMALQQADEFLVELRTHPSAPVAERATKVWLGNQVSKFSDESSATQAQRAESLRNLTEYLSTTNLNMGHASLLMDISDQVAGTPEAPLAVRMINQVLPRIRELKDQRKERIVPLLEGLVRRLELPGNKLELEGTFVDGKPIDWESYRGKVVLVDFWATGCFPCRAEVPNIMANYKAYHDKGFEVVGISLDDDKSAVEAYWEKVGIPWPTLFNLEKNEEGWDHPMAVRYAILGIPQAILVDQEGKVVSMLARGPNLRRELERLLGDPVSPATSSTNKNEEASLPRAETR